MHKNNSEDAIFVRNAGEGLIKMGSLILHTHTADTWCLLDWKQMQKWANELFDDAINADYDGDPNYQPKTILQEGEG